MGAIDWRKLCRRGFATPVHLRKPDRHPIIMAITCADDLVDKDHEGRALAAFVQTLDRSAPIRAREGNAGRDATDPALLVSLWLCANIRRIGSARQLARACREKFASCRRGFGVRHPWKSSPHHGRRFAKPQAAGVRAATQ